MIGIKIRYVRGGLGRLRRKGLTKYCVQLLFTVITREINALTSLQISQTCTTIVQFLEFFQTLLWMTWDSYAPCLERAWTQTVVGNAFHPYSQLIYLHFNTVRSYVNEAKEHAYSKKRAGTSNTRIGYTYIQC